MSFKEELEKRGAREFHIAALSSDENRAMAAIAEAERRGVDAVIPYAMTLFDDPEWTPKGKWKPQLTNLSVDRKCHACGGDRFIPVTDDWSVLYGETNAPCAACNADANTTRYRVDGTLLRTAPR